MSKKPVVVCTEKRGVFFGYLLDDSKSPEVLVLENARMCVYWSSSVKGVVGLAAEGPLEGCKITAPAPKITLYGVTSIFDCSPAAAENWEKGLWS